MRRKSKISRYLNLVKNIKNWKAYLLNKWIKSELITYTTRRKKIRFQVPSNLGGIFKEIFFDEFYALDKIRKKVDSSSVVFDIGTNAGYFTIFLSEKTAPKEIHCFEPFPNNFRLLVRNTHTIQNKPHIFLNNKAVVGSEIDSKDLFFNDNQSFSPTASLFNDFEFTNSTIHVDCINLNQYINRRQIEKVDLLKMDCEGAEYEILYNLPESTLSRINTVYMETHRLNKEGQNTESMVNFLRQNGYKTEVTPVNEKTSMIWAEK